MTYYYYGQDEKGFYADNAAQERQYMDRASWLQIIHAANVPEPTNKVRLQIKEEITVAVYEGETLIRTVTLTPDITEL